MIERPDYKNDIENLRAEIRELHMLLTWAFRLIFLVSVAISVNPIIKIINFFY